MKNPAVRHDSGDRHCGAADNERLSHVPLRLLAKTRDHQLSKNDRRCSCGLIRRMAPAKRCLSLYLIEI
jgi:hypothetical protein